MTVNVYTPALPAIAGTTYTFPFAVLSQADAKIFQALPTFAAGDFILYRKASGAWSYVGNLTTVPALIGVGQKVALMTVLDTEIPVGTQAFAVVCIDALGAQWCDLLIVKDVMTATAIATAAENADAVLDGTIEGAYSTKEILRLMASVLFGKSTGGGTATITFRDTGDAKNRVTATVDVNGNRSTVTLDET